MRLAVVGAQYYYGSPAAGLSFEYATIAGALKDMGIDVTYIGYDINHAMERLEKIVRDVDAVLYMPSENELDMKRFAALPVPKVMLFPDDEWRRDYSLSMAPYADYVMSTAFDAAEVFKDKFIPFQWGARLSQHEKQYTPDINISFIGQNYGYRGQLVQMVEACGLPVNSYGIGWSKSIDDAAIPATLGRSRMSLTTSMSSRNGQRQIKARTFEIPASGALMLAEVAPGLERYYTDGEDAIFWSTPDELIERILFLTMNERARAQIAANGRARTFREHGYHLRFAPLLKVLGEPRQPVTDVYGFLDPQEAALLYRMAASVPANGTIVELGSYQGKSTLELAQGAKVSSAVVYTIDSHDYYEAGGTDFGPADNRAFINNIAKHNAGDVVRVINLRSAQVAKSWDEPVDFLFIDASHEYEDVKDDFERWSPFVGQTGKIAMHDTSGHFEGVSRFVDEMLAAGEWQRVALVDATSIFERVGKHE